jgi:hypothetical protein
MRKSSIPLCAQPQSELKTELEKSRAEEIARLDGVIDEKMHVGGGPMLVDRLSDVTLSNGGPP